MRNIKAVGASTVAIVVGLALIGGSSANAATAPEPALRTLAAAPAPIYPLKPNSVGPVQLAPKAVGSADLGTGVIYQSHVNPTIWQQLLQVPTNGVSNSSKIAPNAIDESDLNGGLREKVNKTGHIVGLQADGPYPGRTDTENLLQNLHEGTEHSSGGPLSEGAQSVGKWQPGTAKQQSWAMCPTGAVVLSGGFGQNDGDDSKLRVVTSAPVQIVKDNDGFHLAYKPIPGDLAGSFVPNGWLVEGYNEGTEAVEMRPQMVCAGLN
jgi:hypothetical protein